METSWTAARVEDLKKRWDAGESYSEIGAALGVSRCAISGKVDRLQLPGRRKGRTEFEIAESQRKAAERNAANQKFRRARLRVQEMQEEIAAMPVYEGSLNIPFADLRDYSSCEANQCRFIADEPPGPEYRACANETRPGEPYCAHCKPITLNKSALTQPERAAIIHMGRRNHLRALRNVA